jgi:hypothetical protein
MSIFNGALTDENVADMFLGIGLTFITPLTEGDIRLIYNNQIQFTLCTVPSNFTFDVDVMFDKTIESQHRRLCIVVTATTQLSNYEYKNSLNIVNNIYSILNSYVKKSQMCKIISNYTEFQLYSFKSQNTTIPNFYKVIKPSNMSWLAEGFITNPIFLAKKYNAGCIVIINRPLFSQCVTCEFQHLFINYYTRSDYFEFGRIFDLKGDNRINKFMIAFKTKNGFIVTQKNLIINEQLITTLYISLNLFQCEQKLWSIDIVKTYPLNSCAIDVEMSSLPNFKLTLIFDRAVLIFHDKNFELLERYSLNAENSLECPIGNQCDFNICTFDNMSLLEKAILPLNGRLIVDHVYKLTANPELAIVKLLLNSTLPVYVLIGKAWSKTCALEVSLILEIPSLVRDVVQRWQLVPYLTKCLL